MIDVKKVREWAEERCAEKDLFLVDLTISSSNQITVLVDSMGRVDITDCMSVSRAIESQLDREVEDFELTVSSAGIGNALKVWKQYEKNQGREVKIRTTEGKEIQGIMQKAENGEVTVVSQKREKIEGKKKKQTVEYTDTLKIEEIAETRVVLQF